MRECFGRLALCGFLASVVPAPTIAADYPDRRVQLIVPYSPGGSMDIVGRTIGQQFTQAWGQPVVIENRFGAGGSIGTAAVARSAPDGYTLLLITNGPITTSLALTKSPQYSSKDFDVINVLAEGGVCVIVNPKLPVHSIQELIGYTRKNPDKTSGGSAGVGTLGHVALTALNRMAGTDMAHIPFPGGGPVLTAVVSGEIQMAMLDYQAARPMIESGQVRAIGTTGSQRSCGSTVPTVAEQGLPEYKIFAWIVLLAPKGTPKAIVDQISALSNKMLADGKFQKMLVDAGFDPGRDNSPQQATEFVSREVLRWSKLSEDAGLKPQ